MIITITGDPGSGKSSVADNIAKKTGMKRFSTGDLQREIAKEKGISINELAILEKSDKTIDLMIDKKTENIGKNEDNFVIDTWLGAKFIPRAFKVYLKSDLEICAKRRVNQKRDTESFSTIEETKKALVDRVKNNQERWIELYSYDYLDMKNYDFVLDTSNITIDEAANIILKKSKKI